MPHQLTEFRTETNVLACTDCDAAISQDVKETKPMWATRMEMFRQQHSEQVTLPPSDRPNVLTGRISVPLAYISCAICGMVTWQAMDESMPAFRKRMLIFAGVHDHTRPGHQDPPATPLEALAMVARMHMEGEEVSGGFFDQPADEMQADYYRCITLARQALGWKES